MPEFAPIGSIPLEEAQSTLDTASERLLGGIVYVKTVNGHGWNHHGHDHYPGYPGVPAPFHVRIDQFFSYRMNSRRGFLGTIAEVGHPFDGFGMICCTRHVGQFNFIDRIARYNLLVCPGVPRLGEPTDPNCTVHWPAFYPTGEVYSYGFADIAESIESQERAKRKR